MKRATRILWMTILVLLFSSCQEEPTFRVIAFNDAETKVTEITENSAHLSCLLEELEQGRYYKYGEINMVITNYPDYFRGQTISGPSYMVKIERLSWSGIPEAKSYSVDIKSLTPSTTYYFAPIVGDNLSNSRVTGEMKSFTTKGIPSISVTTSSATNITNSSATVTGAYTLVNEAKLGEFGILLHTTSYISYYTYTQRQIGNVSPFTYTFTGLTEDKTYYYCAYAKDSKGTIYYGEVKSFTTPKYMASLEEFYGTYTMTYYDDSNPSKMQTWSNVYIMPNQNGSTLITNLPPYGFTAFGSWDNANHYLELSDQYYSSSESITIQSEKCYCVFLPIYYDLVSHEGKWVLAADGYSYINFEWVSDGIIKMTISPKKGENGYSANAFTWYYIKVSSWEYAGTSRFFYNVTLMKTSSSYNAPAKSSSVVPYKCEKITNSYKSWYQKLE